MWIPAFTSGGFLSLERHTAKTDNMFMPILILVLDGDYLLINSQLGDGVYRAGNLQLQLQMVIWLSANL